MHKILVLYGPPAAPEHFRRYYEETHLALAARLPGLLGMRHAFEVQGIGAPSPYFCIWEGDFADEAAMGAAMQSEVGQAVAADTANYASGGLTLLHYAVRDGAAGNNGNV